MMMFEEEIVARNGFWRRSSDKFDQLSAVTVEGLSFTLSRGVNMSSQIKEQVKNIKNQTTLLNEVQRVVYILYSWTNKAPCYHQNYIAEILKFLASISLSSYYYYYD